MIATSLLGKRYRRTWALADCSIDVPAGSLCALVGANGAGKTTLLRLLGGLARPSAGSADVAGRAPSGDPSYLATIGYLAQDIPLYRRWTVEDHLRFGARLNPVWDDARARAHLHRLAIPLDRRIEALSGGMHAQVGLSLILGKRPRVLLLDEPVAALDPLARRDFLATLTEAVVEDGLTVVLSSHLLADLERVCDHLVLLAGGRVALCGDIGEVVAQHKRLTATAGDGGRTPTPRHHEVIHAERSERQTSAVVRMGVGPVEDEWYVEDVGLEEIVLAYLGRGTARELVTR